VPFFSRPMRETVHFADVHGLWNRQGTDFLTVAVR
jgi:hypothetical protein